MCEAVDGFDESKVSVFDDLLDQSTDAFQVSTEETFLECVVEKKRTADTRAAPEPLVIVSNALITVITVDQDEVDEARVHVHGSRVAHDQLGVQTEALAEGARLVVEGPLSAAEEPRLFLPDVD